ncbi:cell surface protein [Serratia plymuthica]|uniref:YfiR family protein n=1 Tax=Serratia plymuthica TaxID=82996 RepID=UPI0007A08F42|nr:YfiR family protein [Serratia plymuthica]KYQ99331.1 cell surface protein [Serratia plymuthica]OJT35939.1 cell surface protein [Serratia plymuthica]
MKMAKNAVMLAASAKSSLTSFICARLDDGRLLPLILVLLLAFPGLARPETGRPYQSRTHAVTTVVVGIISYARWPSEPKPIRLCVTAPTQYAEGLFDPILLSAPRPIKTERVPFDSPLLNTGCDVIYLGNINAGQKQNFIQRIQGHSILSISENDGECSAGSAFCLQIDGDQASFKVNLDALARSGVRVHPNVLQLARKQAPPL